MLQVLAPPPLGSEDSASGQFVRNLQAGIRRFFGPTALRPPRRPARHERAGGVIASVVDPGGRVLVGVFGHVAQLLRTLAARYGATVERVDAQWSTPVDASLMARPIRQNPSRPSSTSPARASRTAHRWHGDSRTSHALGAIQPVLQPLVGESERKGKGRWRKSYVCRAVADVLVPNRTEGIRSDLLINY